ncbi:hypothetical protein K461DRAFT_324351 [Myriangium duriaei CBS 260.36]|uniref:Uncharacterized protein n=1 Tax=Myriangium duriaei CBS 260.36 TaxID=1168546 RepID=A0A9P4IRW4_9PEZI|nr:hypothetical protein K461DRAFT_324351 [Myriangium duriaei CBS 260.36]
MSGNPFRKQQPDNDAVTPKSKGKVKKVQFVSPVASPQEPPSHPRFPSLEELDEGPKSPPPKGLADDPDAVDTRALLRGDLTAGGTIDLKANEREEAAAAASTTTRQAPPPFRLGEQPAGRRGPPANPFSRTLATIEQDSASGRLDGDATKQKPQMDVDAFKRLLLTGNADAVPERQANSARDTGNSTDSSFASKQSVSGSERDTQPESPASSVSSLEDASSEGETTADERLAEQAEQQARYREQVALTTRNTLSQLEPVTKTISFDDFDDEALEPSHVEETTSNISAPPPPARPRRTGSDANKQPPVPPSPRMPGTPTISEFEPQSRKGMVPPPPPSSRRQAHGNLVTRNRSSSNTSQAPSIAESIPQEIQPSNRPKPPPPRAPASRTISKETRRPPSISEPSTDTLSTQSALEAPELSNTTKSKPPPPPTRNTLKQPQQPLNRTPSSSSSISQSHRRPSPSIAGAPPPPPRRRGEGKRTSIDASDSRRSSGHSFGADRRDSVSSLQRAAEEEAALRLKEQKPAVDMLADLDAFQREVDALRARALGGR